MGALREGGGVCDGRGFGGRHILTVRSLFFITSDVIVLGDGTLWTSSFVYINALDFFSTRRGFVMIRRKEFKSWMLAVGITISFFSCRQCCQFCEAFTAVCVVWRCQGRGLGAVGLHTVILMVDGAVLRSVSTLLI